MKMLLRGTVAVALALPAFSSHSAFLFAQGCVAAHSPQPVIAGLNPTSEQSRRSFASGGFLHGLTVTTSFRTYSSFRHYVGTVYQEQRAIKQNALLNHVDLYDVDLNYRLTPRLSVTATIPALTATRRQQNNVNVYRSGGIGDVTLGVESWVWRPPTESHGNIAFSAALKLPTGINDAQGTKIASNGTKQVQPFDESIQPGDGTWGFSIGTQAYRELLWHTSGYFTGSWMFSPADTTGVKTFRSAPGEDVNSAADEYL